MMTPFALEELVKQIQFMDWTIESGLESDRLGDMYIQVVFQAPDVHTGVMEKQYGRKWIVEETHNTADVIRTVHKAIRCAMEHEVDEHFLFAGQRIFDPHKSVIAI